MKELLSKLSQPVSYQWRVQSRNKDKTKAICTAYIDARDVMNILDANCIWRSEFKEVGGFIFAGIGILWEGDWIWRWDCGQRVEDNPNDNMYDQAGKSAASDAFKRAAVQFGIGRFLYDLPTVSLPCDQWNVLDDQGQKIWDITKHINERKINSPKPLEVKEPETKFVAELQELPQEKLDAMLKYITDGKIKEVESAMKKYKLNKAQSTTLSALINQYKTNAVKAAAKK
jgi:hypothetical protein